MRLVSLLMVLLLLKDLQDLFKFLVVRDISSVRLNNFMMIDIWFLRPIGRFGCMELELAMTHLEGPPSSAILLTSYLGTYKTIG